MTEVHVETDEPAQAAPSTTDARVSNDGDATEYRLGGRRGGQRDREPKRTRSGKLSKWDRPPPPHDWRWWVGNVGKTLISVGILMFAFVAYQLWGTGIENAAAQRALEDDFEELLAQFDPIEAPSAGEGDALDPAANETTTNETTTNDDPARGDATAVDTGTNDDADTAAPASDQVVVPIEQEQPVIDPVEVVPVTDQNLPPVEDGDAIAKIEIPRIGVSDIVVAGVKISDLKRGPGHFPDTPLPGQLGNAAIAGHRTTYGAPFFSVDKLDLGDEIRVTTLNGVFVYRVTDQRIVAPSQYSVVATTDPTRSTLTLVSCHPRYTAQQRIIISAELDVAASGAVGEPVLNYGRPDEPPADAAPELPAGADGDADLVAEPDAGLDGTGETVDAADGGDPAAGTDATSSAGGSTSGSLTVEPATADELLTAQADQEIADVFGKGWFSDPDANPHVGFWGLVVGAIAVLAYLLSRQVRRDWVGLLVGIGPFVVALYFFFQNVNRLLPPNL